MQREECPGNRPVVLAACGASGQIYARWVLRILTERLHMPVRLLVSAAARPIVRDELKLGNLAEGLPGELVTLEDVANLENELASGSVPTAGMLVCPCSLNTLAAVAAGLSDQLITRAAQVHLKQRRRLVLAVREMPLGIIDLENMLRVCHAGGIVTPISPPFYHHPAGLDDLAQFAAEKLVQLLLDHDPHIRYQPTKSPSMPKAR